MWGHGLPEHGHFRDLVYNTSAEVLIAAFDLGKPVPGANSAPFGQLYYRHKSATDYKKITGFNEDVRMDTPVSLPDAPLIFFNVWSLMSTGGYDWHSLSSFNLATETMTMQRPEKFATVFEGCHGGWIAGLIASEGDGLIASVAFEHQEADGRARVQYWLCALRVSPVEVNKITRLSATFC
jgi:hypothetical protein